MTLGLFVLALAALPLSVVLGAPAAAAVCDMSPAPISTLDEMAAGTKVGGKSVGADWAAVVLGTVTEVRHKSPKFRYRITMSVDSTLGAELPATYTFFGSSRGTFPFETGSVYAVPLTKRSRSAEIMPPKELWAERCDPVVAVTDLAAAREVIARTKPGYSPAPTASPSTTALPTTDPSETVVAPTPEPASAQPGVATQPRAAFPDGRAVSVGLRVGLVGLAAAALLIGVIAATESWWSRRRAV